MKNWCFHKFIHRKHGDGIETRTCEKCDLHQYRIHTIDGKSDWQNN